MAIAHWQNLAINGYNQANRIARRGNKRDSSPASGYSRMDGLHFDEVFMSEKLPDYGYHGLDANERWVIHQYFEYNEPWYVAQYILRIPECVNRELSDPMARFIADFIMGKAKRPKGKKPPMAFERKRLIHYHIDRLLINGNTLRANAVRDGVAAFVGDFFNVTEDVAIKAYQEIKQSNEIIIGEDLYKDIFPELYQF